MEMRAMDESSAGDRITVVDDPEESRYEATMRPAGAARDLDGLGVAAYARQGGTIMFLHTEVPESMSGHGVGQALARFALDDARRLGLEVVPQCPFIAAYIRRHREYLDLVPPAARGLLERR
jgi:predicted GNAT family acetyltransferase